MKKLSLFLVALLSALTLSAQSYSNVSGTFAWTVGNESNATASEAVAGALQESRWAHGTDLTVGTKSDYVANPTTMVTYQPGTSNPGFAASDMVEYSVKMKKGITFTPTSFTYDALKDGTDNAHYSWSYVIDGVESTIVEVSQDDILRNNNGNASTASLGHTENILGAQGGREVKFRLYVSHFANNKKVAFSNIKLNGLVNGEEEQRAFQNFTINMRDSVSIYNLPAGVTLMNTPSYNGGQHGYVSPIFQVVVDGPVRFKIGGCRYSNTPCTIYDGQTLLASLDVKAADCDNATDFNHYVTYVYNSETPTTLTINCAQYCPFIIAEACELIPLCYVSYFDVDGRTLLHKDTVEGNSALAYSIGAEAVTIAEGHAFRGWFNDTKSSALKVPAGTTVQEDLSLYAKTTPIEEVTPTSRFIYDLTKINFYVEDHEAIDMPGGKFHDAQHGWDFGNGGKIILPVAGKALITVGNCQYSSASLATVTNIAGTEIDTFTVKVPADGQAHVIRYDGPADTLTITFSGTTYIHKVVVYNVVDFVEYDETTGYYVVPAGDANSFLLALTDANATGNRKIYLPNGLYDLGELALTTVSGANISIIGESMTGTIIRNAPLVENEGIGTTATLLNTSTGLYLQDLTLQNALDYYKSGSAGRAVCLQDEGFNTVCKNVRMLSYQDTYYSHKGSSFYWEDGEIHGTVDYLCGDGNVLMNRMLFVNESRSASGKSGSDVICAPNCTATTDARTNWGYVFLDCSVRSESNDFTFARSWGGESKAAFIRTSILDNSLNESRWTAAGMNKAASSFKEYGTMDAQGNNICPSTFVVNFTHSSGNNEIETILSADEAAQYTVTNIFGNWGPDAIAAQVRPQSVATIAQNGDLTWVGNAPAYLVSYNGQQVLTTANSLNVGAEAQNVSVRAANGRGGFGPAMLPGESDTAIDRLQAEKGVQKLLQNGQLVILKDGVRYSALGTVIR